MKTINEFTVAMPTWALPVFVCGRLSDGLPDIEPALVEQWEANVWAVLGPDQFPEFSMVHEVFYRGIPVIGKGPCECFTLRVRIMEFTFRS
jgi:hypothetical protein